MCICGFKFHKLPYAIELILFLFILVSDTFYWFILVTTFELSSSLLLSADHFMVCIHYIMFTHSPRDGHLAYNSLYHPEVWNWTYMGVPLRQILRRCCIGKQVQILLISLMRARFHSRITVPEYILTSSLWDFPFPISSPTFDIYLAL